MSKKGTLGLHKGGPFSSNFAPIFAQTARIAAKKKARQTQTQSQIVPESQPESQAEDICNRLVIDERNEDFIDWSENGNLDNTAMPSSENESVVPTSETEIVSGTCSI